jgi:hypothetical protein
MSDKYEWLERIPVEQRRAYVAEEVKKAAEIAEAHGLFYIVIIWCAGIDAPKLQSMAAYFTRADDARYQEKVWAEELQYFANSTYGNFI